MNLAELILAEPDLKREPFPTPEWPSVDGKLWVQELTAEQRVARSIFYEQAGADKEEGRAADLGKLRQLWAYIAVMGIVDETFARVFTDEQATELGKKKAAVVERAYDRILELSGLTKQAAEATAKNSEAPPSEPQ